MAVSEFTTPELKPKERWPFAPRPNRRTGQVLKCEQCGESRYVPLNRLKTFRYCSPRCKGTAIAARPEVRARRAKIVWPSGTDHHNWKGGTVDHYGYMVIRINKKRILEHRYVMEQHLGRTLKPAEVIHHINEIKTDNRIENLELTTQSEHIAAHQRLNGKWAKYYDRCRGCGQTSKPHYGRGRCRPCYRRER